MSSERTEKPTQKRLQKTRDEGNYVVSKEFVAAIQFLAFYLILHNYGETFLIALRGALQSWLRLAFSRAELDREALVTIFRDILAPGLAPVLIAGATLTGAALLAQLGVSRFGISAGKLAPNLNKLNPASRIKELPRQNLFSAGQALVLLPLFLLVVYLLAQAHLPALLALPRQSAAGIALTVGSILSELMTKACFIFLLVGTVDWYRQQSRYTKQLKMTKQEIKDEFKESEGNPQVKGKLRKMQRDLSRRQMMANVPKASAVIVNPTHYAVAIRYDLASAGAPRVVAKGKNHLALRIRQLAISKEIPIIENAPLARALYAAADVGQEIPPHLYRAVAEILAYLFRLLGGRLPGTASA